MVLLVTHKKMEDFVIPIDSAVKSFYTHILANPRTILSSKFGDGKSYFLENFRNTDFVKEQFVFLTIYPVNYQVASNEDIFNLIKRDILFQLMLNDMISNSVVIPKDIALWFYLQGNKRSLAADLIHYMAEIAVPSEHLSKIMMALKGLRLFKDLKKKLESFTEDNSEDNILSKFLDEVNANTVYEEDIITAIIKRAVNDFKRRTNKSVVLIIEDLDRIDPAHLFRILNIFSAHMDYAYKNFTKPDMTQVGNKFNLDNVVLVGDYSNIRKVFKHFYGEHTDFNGYIGKFLSSKPFMYSLRQERLKYIYERLSTVTGCPVPLVKIVLSEDTLESKTIRDIIHSFEIDNQINKEAKVITDGKNIVLCPAMLKLLAVMRRLRISDEDMITIPTKVYAKNQNLFLEYIAPYMLLTENDNIGTEVNIYYRDEDGIPHQQRCKINEETGKGEPSGLFRYSGKEEKTDFSSIINRMLEFIVN